MMLTSEVIMSLDISGSRHMSHVTRVVLSPLPYSWLLATTQIMDSGLREFLIYWLQAKQRVTAVFSNQQEDLWCLPSAALCQPSPGQPSLCCSSSKDIFDFPSDPPCVTCCWKTDEFCWFRFSHFLPLLMFQIKIFLSYQHLLGGMLRAGRSLQSRLFSRRPESTCCLSCTSRIQMTRHNF